MIKEIKEQFYSKEIRYLLSICISVTLLTIMLFGAKFMLFGLFVGFVIFLGVAEFIGLNI